MLAQICWQIKESFDKFQNVLRNCGREPAGDGGPLSANALVPQTNTGNVDHVIVSAAYAWHATCISKRREHLAEQTLPPAPSARDTPDRLSGVAPHLREDRALPRFTGSGDRSLKIVVSHDRGPIAIRKLARSKEQSCAGGVAFCKSHPEESTHPTALAL